MYMRAAICYRRCLLLLLMCCFVVAKSHLSPQLLLCVNGATTGVFWVFLHMRGSFLQSYHVHLSVLSWV